MTVGKEVGYRASESDLAGGMFGCYLGEKGFQLGSLVEAI